MPRREAQGSSLAGARTDRGRLHVVAAVLRDARGRVLLTQRIRGDHAGAWEFPGGKCERGEAPAAALRRELREELGIDCGALTPLIAVPHHTDSRQLLLDAYRVDDYTGQPRGMENQRLLWLPEGQLRDYTMPPADLPIVAALTQPALYAISPDLAESSEAERAIERGMDRLLEQGIRCFQLRCPRWAVARTRLLAARMLPRCARYGALLLLNADIAAAGELGCGVHLRAAQLCDLSARPLPQELPVAASCHDRRELLHAQQLGLDFVVLGPVRHTKTHPAASVLGWGGFAALRSHCSLPIHALGGLGPDDLAAARRHGAQGVAGIRGVWGEPELGSA